MKKKKNENNHSADPLKDICMKVLNKWGLAREEKEELSEDLSIEILKEGYVKMENIMLDPGKTVSMLVNILNDFSNEKPFTTSVDK